MSRKGGAVLQKDVPWRGSPSGKPIPKIHHSPVLCLPQTPYTDCALSVMKHPNPVGCGLGKEAIVEAAGPDCIVPGQITPVKILGLKLWPIDINFKFLEPVGRELKLIGKDEEKLRKGPWFEEEDEQLIATVTLLGERRWDALAKASGLKRSGKSCRLRWMNYLRPDLKHGRLSEEEEKMIIQLYEQWGNKWSRIAGRLPGRTDNEIKNYWRTHLRRKARIQEKGKDRSSNIMKGENFMISECDNRNFIPEKNDSLGSSFDSSDVLEPSKFAVTDLPNDIELYKDWICCVLHEQNEKPPGNYCNSENSLVSLPFCNFGDCDDGTGDCSNSIWNID